MKKKICTGCGKLINFNSICECRKNDSKFKYHKYEKGSIIHTTSWRKKRLEIIKRDIYCQRCLIKYNLFNTDDLTVHHIKSRNSYPELAFDDNNLVTLCRSCNSKLGSTSNKLDFEWEHKEIEENWGLY